MSELGSIYGKKIDGSNTLVIDFSNVDICGNLNINGFLSIDNSFGSVGQVLTSQGNSLPPVWGDIASGSGTVHKASIKLTTPTAYGLGFNKNATDRDATYSPVFNPSLGDYQDLSSANGAQHSSGTSYTILTGLGNFWQTSPSNVEDLITSVGITTASGGNIDGCFKIDKTAVYNINFNIFAEDQETASTYALQFHYMIIYVIRSTGNEILIESRQHPNRTAVDATVAITHGGGVLVNLLADDIISVGYYTNEVAILEGTISIFEVP
jgi:hypothetical protein